MPVTCSTLGRNGRLGNQLFQFATVYSYAKRNNFKIVLPFVEQTDDKYLTLEINKCFNLNCTEQKNLNFIKYSYRENGFSFDNRIFNLNLDNIDFFGYFQSEKYFKDFSDDLKLELSFKKFIIDESSKIFKELNPDSKQCVSIHVRRGDYVGANSLNHPVLPETYYIRSLNLLSGDNIYFIFSDDIQWCKSNKIFSGENFKFIETDNHFLDLCLMSMCNHNIIANSSFSWWGAWLNCNKNKSVIAPYPWFGPSLSHLNTKDLIPNEWRIVKWD